MKTIKSIFLSAIHQNAGKTTVSLGLYRAFRDRGLKTAFMKPIGQKVVTVGNQNVDKDSYLIGEVFRYRGKFKEMSPVTLGRGFTEKYIFNPNQNILQRRILGSFRNLIRGKDAIIIEGTGHAAVGSVIDLSNADTACLLGSKAIIISEGGIGRSIDEICLNKALFDLKGVEVLGVIVNKVMPEKYKKIKRSVGQGLKNKGIRLLGVIPQDPILTFPTVEQLMNHLDLKLLCGETNLKEHVEHAIVAAMDPHNMITYLRNKTLIITSGDREDNILVSVTAHALSQKRNFRIAGLILTGGLLPHPKIVDLLKKSKVPVLLSSSDTYKVAAKVESLTCKIEKTDTDKIAEASWLVKKYVDVDTILKNL